MAILGNNATPASYNSGNLDRIYAVAVTPSGGNFSIATLHAWESGAGAFRLAVYADSAGLPGALLCYTNLTGGAAADRSGAPSTPTTLTNGVTYWLAFHFGGSTVGMGQMANGTGASKFKTGATYASGAPNPFGASPSSGTALLCVWVDGTLATPSTFVPQVVIM